MARTSRGVVASVYGLLLLGVSAIGIAVLPGTSALEPGTLVSVVSGETAFDGATLALSGGLFLVGVAAILISSLLIGAGRRR